MKKFDSILYKGLCALLTLLLLAALLPLGSVTVSAAAAEITDAEGLLAMAEDPAGEYVLGADIDLAGVEWTPFAFSGSLDGAGHSLLNLTVRTVGEEVRETADGNDKRYDTVFAGLFSVLEGASVKDLTLLGPVVEIETEENCFIGTIAGYSADANVSGCRIEAARLSLTQCAYQCGVGGVIGFGSGTITGTSVEAELTFVDTNSEENCEEFLGGAYSCGFIDVSECDVSVAGYASVVGYVHNGGLVGMYHVHDTIHTGEVADNTVTGFITFFENNEDRRAYCEAEIGEILGSVSVSGNTADFESKEVFEYDTLLLPESCGEPDLKETVTEAGCVEMGYTTVTCSGCGHSYRKDYTLPGHEPGEWALELEPTVEADGLEVLRCVKCGEALDERAVPAHVEGEWLVVRGATYEEEGLECLYCADCGELLGERILPRLTHVETVEISDREVAIRYKGQAQVGASVAPSDAFSSEIFWSSSDGNVAHVDSRGVITGEGRGTAVITCGSVDGYAEDTCTVTVTFAWWQWVIYTVGFGFLWY